jgi:hypothetical protein
MASSTSLQTATALATTVFATFGPLGAGLRFLAGAVALLAFARPRARGRASKAWAAIVGSGDAERDVVGIGGAGGADPCRGAYLVDADVLGEDRCATPGR